MSPGDSETTHPTTSLADRLAFSLWLPAAIAAALTAAVGRLVAAEDLLRLWHLGQVESCRTVAAMRAAVHTADGTLLENLLVATEHRAG